MSKLFGRDKAKDVKELQQMMHYHGADDFKDMLVEALRNAADEVSSMGNTEAEDLYAAMYLKLEEDV